MYDRNWAQVEEYIGATAKGKAYLMNELSKKGFSYIDTHTNFIHIDFKENKKHAQAIFAKRSINVQKGLPLAGFENFLRITLGPKDAMETFIRALEEL